MVIENPYLYRFALFIIIYLLALSKDVFFMIYWFFKDDAVYWNNILFYEAFIRTLIVYVPLFIIHWLLTNFGAEDQKQEKEKKTQQEKEKKERKLYRDLMK